MVQHVQGAYKCCPRAGHLHHAVRPNASTRDNHERIETRLRHVRQNCGGLRINSLLARDAQTKLALIVAQCLSIHPSICPSVCLSATASVTHVRSIARREPPRLPACQEISNVAKFRFCNTVYRLPRPEDVEVHRVTFNMLQHTIKRLPQAKKCPAGLLFCGSLFGRTR